METNTPEDMTWGTLKSTEKNLQKIIDFCR